MSRLHDKSSKRTPATSDAPGPDAEGLDGSVRRPDTGGKTDAPDPTAGRWGRVRRLVDRLPGAVYRCTYDTAWTSLYMGDGFREITGIDPNSLDTCGRTFRDVVHDDDIPSIQTAVAAAVRDRTYYSLEYRIQTDDGRLRWIQDNGRPYFADGGVRWLDGILLDITRRKETEQSLRELTESLEETVQKRTKQVRALAAELSMVELQERSDIAQTLHDELQQFLYGVQVKARMLTNDIKDHPDIDSSTLSVDPAEVDRLLQQAIRTTRGLTVDLAPPVLDSDGLVESLQWLRSHLRETRDVTVELSRDELDTQISDEMRLVLFQAIREILFNVFTLSGVDSVHIVLREEAEDLVIQVGETSSDIRRDRGRISHTKSVGLRAAGQRMRLLGGTFRVDTTPATGTTCTIRFPKHRLQDVPAFIDEEPAQPSEPMDDAASL